MSIKNKITIFALIFIFKTNEVISSFGELTTSYIFIINDSSLFKKLRICVIIIGICSIDLLNKKLEGWGTLSDEYLDNMPK